MSAPRSLRWAVPLLLTITAVGSAQPMAEPLDRKKWVLVQTLGPASLAGGLFSAGLSTWRDKPREYDTNWSGFGKRYGLRLTGVATSNVMEASIGSLWGEDPRYHRSSGGFKQRLGSVLKQTALVQHSDGSYGPAYARYIAIPGSNLISNAWRPDSEANFSGAMTRTGYGFLGRLAGNAFAEFGGEAVRLFGKKPRR